MRSYDREVSSKPLLLVQFYAPWCKLLLPLPFCLSGPVASLPPLARPRIHATVKPTRSHLYRRTLQTVSRQFSALRPGTRRYTVPKKIVGSAQSRPPPLAVRLLPDCAPPSRALGRLLPQYELAARTLAQEGHLGVMAKLDAVVEKASARKNSIRTYPTIKLFKCAIASRSCPTARPLQRPGSLIPRKYPPRHHSRDTGVPNAWNHHRKGRETHVYEGQHTSEAMAEYMQGCVRPSASVRRLAVDCWARRFFPVFQRRAWAKLCILLRVIRGEEPDMSDRGQGAADVAGAQRTCACCSLAAHPGVC